MVATAAVEPKYKVRWLKLWNSREFVRNDPGFLKYHTSEDTLKKWMDRAAIWEGIEESATQELVGYISLVGGVDKSKDVESLEDYIDTWRICLWDKAFNFLLSESNAYNKYLVFDKVKDGDLIVKWLCLRYELVIYSFRYIFSNANECLRFSFSVMLCVLCSFMFFCQSLVDAFCFYHLDLQSLKDCSVCFLGFTTAVLK